MNYLQQTGLQTAVSEALVKVINERAGGFGPGAGQAARERICELLLPEARKATAPASAEQIDQRKKAEQKAEAFEQQTNRLTAENRKLSEMLHQAQRDVDGLRGEPSLLAVRGGHGGVGVLRPGRRRRVEPDRARAARLRGAAVVQHVVAEVDPAVRPATRPF